ncbi:ATP-grasp domain-containing protein [Glaciecola sp. 1036]|uniref:ATP-grasp domain-containing protein n=1 Tax=Alteromonadaceae TaxID=72275 RepID=UPI003D0570AF
MKKLLILGDLQSPEVQSIMKICRDLEHHVFVLNTSDAAQLNLLHFDVTSNALFLDQVEKLCDFDAVYWQQVTPIKFGLCATPNLITYCNDESAYIDHIQREYASLIQILLSEYRIAWFNGWHALQFYRAKPRQLTLAQSLGANIPPTLITSNPSTAHSFIESQQNVVVKPVLGGATTFTLSKEYKQLEAIQKWCTQPVTLQSFVLGKDIRTYVIGDEDFSFIIHKQTETFQSVGKTKNHVIDVEPINLPSSIKQLAQRLMRAFHMRWTAIDWRLTPKGNFVFIAADPIPRFVENEKLTNIPISEKLSLLLSST